MSKKQVKKNPAMKKSKKAIKKIRSASRRPKFLGAAFIIGFAAIGSYLIITSRAATGACSTNGVIGSSAHRISIAEAGQYKVWARVQVPDTSNTGVRVELGGNQCFTITTANTNAVNQWQWVNAADTTSSLTAGERDIKVLGLKAGVKVDKVILVKSSSVCVPQNNSNAGLQPGDNCLAALPAITSFTATPASITSGSTSRLAWTTTDTASCSGSGAWGESSRAKNNTGINTANLTANSTFTLTCIGVSGDTVTKSVTVTVTAAPAPTVTLLASPTSVVTGSASVLTWSSTNAATCTASGAWSGSKSVDGPHSASTGNLTANQTYNLSCTGPGGTTNKSVSVTVTATPPANDTTKPEILFSWPTGTKLSSNDTVGVVDTQRGVTLDRAALASDASGIKSGSVVVTVNGQVLTGSQIKIGVDKVTGGTANGDYVVKIDAADNANNTSTRTFTIKVRHPDVNRDGRVDSSDITPILLRWRRVIDGETISASDLAGYDLNNDGKINSMDITRILTQWINSLKG